MRTKTACADNPLPGRSTKSLKALLLMLVKPHKEKCYGYGEERV